MKHTRVWRAACQAIREGWYCNPCTRSRRYGPGLAFLVLGCDLVLVWCVGCGVSAAGILQPGYPITWRNDSGVLDGRDQNRDLVGGFYDGGSNIKYHFPMAYTITMLSWALLEYEGVYQMWGMDTEMADLIQWGVDYLLKARYENLYFTQVSATTPDTPPCLPPLTLLLPFKLYLYRNGCTILYYTGPGLMYCTVLHLTSHTWSPDSSRVPASCHKSEVSCETRKQ